MATALIKLAYRHIIDASAKTDFDRKVFHTTYQEFLMKSQTYNMERKFSTFDEMKSNDGRANSLHYKLAIAANHHVEELKNVMPALHDHMGNTLKFETPDFKLLASDIADINAHKVAINFITPQLTLFNTISECMILAVGEHRTTSTPVDTFMLTLQPGLSVISYQEI
ncbi:hypothetical protein KXQ82_09840 [Mucilaginibacter sp. HMF5004]|uniref:hypothetical protein n=1 Tax=Mucilaginibacter rivuli TaxID=2857527 RepID=UPI001C5DD2C0|nr:hypothetical protein [Mucilaginibacter rivuli]MBW4890019.1 hypothetical protein [Mucilaginibacter rivuli]